VAFLGVRRLAAAFLTSLISAIRITWDVSTPISQSSARISLLDNARQGGAYFSQSWIAV